MYWLRNKIIIFDHAAWNNFLNFFLNQTLKTAVPEQMLCLFLEQEEKVT